MQVETRPPVLIVGGYGVVGQKITQMLSERHGDLPVLLGGRNPPLSENWVNTYNNVAAVAIDISQPQPLRTMSVLPAAVISVANDPHDYLLKDCIEKGIPFLDITRWTERITHSLALARQSTLSAPVIFASGWMAGNIALIAAAYKQQFQALTAIDIDVLYALADSAGPNSFEYMDRLTVPFYTCEKGELRKRMPLSDGKRMLFKSGYRCTTYRFDTPDQKTLPQHLNVGTVNARIAFDDVWLIRTLIAAKRVGLLRLLNLPRFDGLRRRLMYNPGAGAAHEVEIALEGIARDGTQKHVYVNVRDPQGQTHLTACGAIVQLEWLLGLGDVPAASVGVHFAEQHPDPALGCRMLVSQGVEITEPNVSVSSPLAVSLG